MAFQDRAYYRDEGDGSFGSPLRGASMTTWLLGINIIIFFIDSILRTSSRGHWLAPSSWGHFSIDTAVYGLQLWRWLTYQFIHEGLFHILFNMIGLYFFGRLMEQWWGSRRFLAFYLLCGSLGAVVFTALAHVPGVLNVTSQSELVGASGSIFGILAGCAVLFPHQRVMLLIPPIPMSMRTMALLFLGLSALSVIAGGQNAGGDAAHLGGALLGWFLVRRPRLLDFADHGAPAGFQGFAIGRSTGAQGFLARWRQRRAQQRAERQREHEAREFAEVDRILAKVKASGLHSLTDREKRTLQRETDRKRNAG